MLNYIKLSRIFLIIVIISLRTYGQQNFILENQDSINNFDEDSIFGSLLISGDSVIDLSSLSSLRYIENNLVIENTTNLEGLKGLDNIDYIGDSLIVKNNSSLSNCCEIIEIFYLDSKPTIIIENNFNLCLNENDIKNNCFKDIYLCGVSNLVDTFHNQNEIDQFNCNHYLGSIHIESDSIFDLSPLSILTNINGNLIIKNCSNLSSISLINTLDSIGGTLQITNNPRLGNINIEGIDSVQKISIINNDSLTQINLNNNSDSLIIENNNQLEACCDLGFNPYSDDTTKVSISNNATGCNSLESLNWSCNKVFFPCGREGYTDTLSLQSQIIDFSCGEYFGSLHIEANEITDLTPLQILNKIDGDLTVKNCTNLLSIELSETIDSIGGSLKIVNNPKLGNINIGGIDSVQKISIINNDSLTQITLSDYSDSLVIENNKLLEACCDLGINPIEDDTSKVSISNNATGCNSLQSLDWSCNKVFFPCGREGYIDTFSLQSQINDFPCGEYYGSLHIEADEITDLTPLEILNKIDGNLTIQNCTNLLSINLSETIDSIGGALQIINSQRLQSISVRGIDSVKLINITNNDSLTMLTMNNNFDSLIIEDNEQLETCCDLGFNPNSDDTTKVSITNNASGCNSLESLYWSCNTVFFPCGRQGYTDTFNTAESINNFECSHYQGSMIIDYDSVDEPVEFYAPNKISGNLTIENNNDLTDLFFLENLDSVKNLKIENCENLKTIVGLNIKSIDTLTLQNNTKLYACDEIISLIDSGILNSNQIILDSNLRSCNNLNQIQHFKRQRDYPCGETELTDTLIYQFEIDSFNCQYFTGSLIIKDNQILNLDGLKNLKSINHSLSLINLNINSIDTLALNITEKFTIKNNKELKNISNIVLREPASVIEISNNDSLSVINNLPFGDSLIIKNNKSLDNCCIIAENLFEESDKYIFIDSNNTNCSRLNVIKNYCLETAFPCGILGVTDTFKENSDFDIECIEYNGNIYVTGSNLDAIDSSNNIININGDLIMEGINQPNLFGFENIENINGNLIFKNNSIINLKAFRNLYEIQNRLIVDSNNRLTNSPIDAETFVRNITLTNNDSMRFLYFGDGQTNQNRLKSIEISGNQNLESIDGMFSEHMDSIKISNNLNLISVNAISFTDTVYDILEVRDNPKLSECCSMEPLLNSLSDTSSTVINISNNADSCISVESILNNCQVFTSYKQQKYNTYDLKINQNNSSFIELSGSALENSDKIYVIGITGNIIACLPYNNSKKQTLNIENYPSGLYLIAASSENRVLKAVKLFKK